MSDDIGAYKLATEMYNLSSELFKKGEIRKAKNLFSAADVLMLSAETTDRDELILLRDLTSVLEADFNLIAIT